MNRYFKCQIFVTILFITNTIALRPAAADPRYWANSHPDKELSVHAWVAECHSQTPIGKQNWTYDLLISYPVLNSSGLSLTFGTILLECQPWQDGTSRIPHFLVPSVQKWGPGSAYPLQLFIEAKDNSSPSERIRLNHSLMSQEQAYTQIFLARRQFNSLPRSSALHPCHTDLYFSCDDYRKSYWMLERFLRQLGPQIKSSLALRDLFDLTPEFLSDRIVWSHIQLSFEDVLSQADLTRIAENRPVYKIFKITTQSRTGRPLSFQGWFELEVHFGKKPEAFHKTRIDRNDIRVLDYWP